MDKQELSRLIAKYLKKIGDLEKAKNEVLKSIDETYLKLDIAVNKLNKLNE